MLYSARVAVRAAGSHAEGGLGEQDVSRGSLGSPLRPGGQGCSRGRARASGSLGPEGLA